MPLYRLVVERVDDPVEPIATLMKPLLHVLRHSTVLNSKLFRVRASRVACVACALLRLLLLRRAMS